MTSDPSNLESSREPESAGTGPSGPEIAPSTENGLPSESAPPVPVPAPPVPAAPAPPALPTRRILRRFSHLLILTSLVAIPLIYPLQIREGLDYRITRKALTSQTFRYLWVEQLQPALFAGYDPLTLKRIVWAFLTLALACTHLLWKILPDRPGDSSRRRRLSLENFAILAFVLWAGLSLVLWLPKAQGTDKSWGGFLFSLDSWSDLVIGVAFFFLTADLLRRRRWVFKGIGLLFGSATIVALLAIGQRQGWTASFLTRWTPEEYRNRMASLIGQNTGMASFLMAPFLLSLVLGLPRWRQLKRPLAILLGLFWLLMILTVTMAQSRAVALILLVAVPVMLWKLHRTSGLSPGRRAWTLLGGVLLFVILSQVIPAEWNPLYDRVVPLTERVHDLSLSRLKAETRLRILVCSIPLISRAPLQGNGFGSFQYVYPKAQGEYFQDHPDTFLVPTGLRTERAHDEYLQTLIETGIVGLALALLSLGLVLRRGWIAYSHTLRPDDIPIQIGLLAGIIVILIHATVDFPFRVPPIAVTLVWMLAVWEAGRKIWLPRRGRHVWPEDEDTQTGFTPNAGHSASAPETPYTEPPVAHLEKAPARKGEERWVLWGVGAAAVVAFMLVISAWYSRQLSADVLDSRANHTLSTYLAMNTAVTPASERFGLLKEGRNLFRRALRLRPVDGNLLYVKGFVECFLAREALAQARSAERAGAKKDNVLWLSECRSYVQASLVSLRLALSELRYHQVFFVEAEDYRVLGEADDNPQDLVKARDLLETSIDYTPAYPEAIVSLIHLIQKEFPAMQARRNALLALLYKYNPHTFFYSFVIEGDKAVEDERYNDAIRIFRDLSEAVPNDTSLLSRLASAYLKANDLEKCEAVLTELSQVEPRPVSYDSISSALAIRRGQWKRALAFINQVLHNPKGDLDYYRVMKYLIQEKAGETNAARDGFQMLLRKAKRDPQVYLDLANAIIENMKDTRRAVPYIRDFMRQSDSPAPPRMLFVLARYEYREEHKTADAVNLLKQALRIQPDHQPSRDLLREILGQKKIPPSPSPKTPAAPKAS